MTPQPPWTRGERCGLLALCLLALGLRWFHVHSMQASPYFAEPVMDPAFHVDWARAFAAGESFRDGPFFRAPLYPWFLGVLLKILGPELLLPRLVQGLLGAATTALVYGIGRRCFGRAAAFLSASLAATSWVLVYFDGELLIPALYVPLLLAGILASLKLGEAAAGRTLGTWAAVAGLLFGVAALARPNVLLFLPLLALWVLLRPWGKDWRAALLFSLGVLLPILPISLHNRVSGGEWVLISSQAGVNLWIGNNPASDGSTAIVPGTPGGWWEGFHGARELARLEAGRDLSDGEISRHYSQKVWDWARTDPGAFLRGLAWKFRLFWTDWELGNNQEIRFFARRFNPLSRLSVPFSLLAGLGLVGALRALLKQGRQTFPLWGFLLVYSASVIAFFVCSRFRVPVLPVLMLFSGHALVLLWGSLRERRLGAAAGLALPALLIAGFSQVLPASILTGGAGGFGQLALAEQRSGDHERAVELLEEGLGAQPNHRYLRAWLATSLMELGELPRAVRLLEETLEDYPLQPEALGALLEARFRQGKYPELIERAQQALIQNPGLADVRYQLGRAQYQLGQPKEALESFRLARQQDPRDFRAPFAMGVILAEVYQDGEGAKEALRAALNNREQAPLDFAAQAEALLLRLDP